MKLFSKLAEGVKSLLGIRRAVSSQEPAGVVSEIKWSGPPKSVRQDDLVARWRRKMREARVRRPRAMCPSCRNPLRRRLAGGLGATDRYFDKQMGCMVCTACAHVRPETVR